MLTHLSSLSPSMYLMLLLPLLTVVSMIENMSVSQDILDGEPPTLTEVTVTIRQRSAGVYNCTVSNARVEDGTIAVNGTNVTASPGFATVMLNGMIQM